MSLPRNHLHALTAILLLPALLAMIFVEPIDVHFSDALKRRTQLGLPAGLNHVLIAVEFARSPEDFRAIFGGAGSSAVAQSKADRDLADKGLDRDLYLIAWYLFISLALGLRTWQPKFPFARWRRLILVILPVLIAICGVLENRCTHASLHDYPDISAAVVRWTGNLSRVKWMLGFLEMMLLGRSMIGLERKPNAGAFLRELTGLILISAGVFGLVGYIFPSIITTLFAFGRFALVPIGLMLFFRDHWWYCTCGLKQLRW